LFEQTAVDIIDDKTIRIYFSAIPKGSMSGSVVSIVDNIEKPVTTFFKDNLDKPYIDINVDSTEINWTESNEYELFTSNKNNKTFFLNTSASFLKISSESNEYIVKPFGIIPLEDKNISVYKSCRMIVKISKYSGDANLFAFNDTDITNFAGYNIGSRDYFINKNINNLSTANKGFQLGPALIDENPLKINPDNSVTAKNGMVYKYDHKEIYYKNNNETEYKKAIYKDAKYLDENGNIIAKELFVELEQYPWERDELLYKVSYVKKNDKIYKVYHKAINPYGFVLYNKDFLHVSNACKNSDFENINSMDIPLYIAGETIKVDEEHLTGRNYKTGNYETIDFTVNKFPGLFADKGMCILGGGIITEHFADISIFDLLRSHSNRNGKAVYFIIKQKGERKLIVFPQTEEKDAFIDTDNSTIGLCGDLKQKGFYECKIFEDSFPVLFTATGEYDPFGRTLKKIRRVSLNTLVERNNIYSGIHVEPTIELIPGVRAYFMGALTKSYILESVDNYRFSYLLNKEIAVCKEVGLVLDNTTLGIKEPFNIKIHKDKNIRGVSLKAGDVSILITIDGKYLDSKMLKIEIVKNGKTIASINTPWIPFAVKDKNTNKISYGTEHSFENSPVMYFAYEGFINYLVANNIYVNTLIDVDETNGIINEEDTTFVLNTNTAQGEKVEAYINNNEVTVMNVPAASYYLKNKQPYPVYGDFKIFVTKTFLYDGFNFDSNEEFISKLISKLKDASAEIYTYFGYELYRPVNFYIPYRLAYDVHFLALEDKKTFTVPDKQRVGVMLFNGYGNKISSTKPFNGFDFIYKRIDGMVFEDYIDENTNKYTVKYSLPIEEYVLNREISVNLDEQASFFDKYYNNAKTQLIQDVREDTANKRYKGVFVHAKFDTQEIYNQIKTLETDLWAIPISFRCANMPNEAEINNMVFSERINSKDFDFDYGLNTQASKMVFFDDAGTVELSALNAVFENNKFSSYDFTDMYSRYINKELLYNDDNIKTYNYNENISLKDRR